MTTYSGDRLIAPAMDDIAMRMPVYVKEAYLIPQSYPSSSSINYQLESIVIILFFIV